MGCLRRREFVVQPEQKWEYISLNDFKSSSCWQPFTYGYLWFSLILSTAVYAVDTFTAINLLAFNKWSGEIQPSQIIPFDVSKWIFSICIILSFINLAFEHIRARRVMNRGGVAECYLDNLAALLECARPGSGRGWKRFLVFAELTKSKKGAEYLALFTYFSFQSWIRVLVCSGPRQVINALTLYSVYNAKLQINGDTFETSLLNFFAKIKALASEDYQQALILSGMLFTLVIWIFSFLFLAAGALCYVFFLWHYIPRADGGLSRYCERKANKRLMQIVSKKINKAMAEDERRRKKAEFKAAKKKGGDRPISMRATLPNVGLDTDDKFFPVAAVPALHRNDTTTTLPAYTSRPHTPSAIELNAMDQRRPLASRTATMTTSASSVGPYSGRQPLLGAAASFGVSRSQSPAPSLPPLDMTFQPPARTGTATSARSYGGGPPPMNRAPTNGSSAAARSASPMRIAMEGMPPLSLASPVRSPIPLRSVTTPMPSWGPESYGPQRSMTGPTSQLSSSSFLPADSNGRLNDNQAGTANSQRPGTGHSQRSAAPHGGYAGRGWDQDRERGVGGGGGGGGPARF